VILRAAATVIWAGEVGHQAIQLRAKALGFAGPVVGEGGEHGLRDVLVRGLPGHGRRGAHSRVCSVAQLHAEQMHTIGVRVRCAQGVDGQQASSAAQTLRSAADRFAAPTSVSSRMRSADAASGSRLFWRATFSSPMVIGRTRVISTACRDMGASVI
jgi:hypothetical protein